jgi:hypothetical protein
MIIKCQPGNMKGRENSEDIVSYGTATLRWHKNK